jgi:galactokinase
MLNLRIAYAPGRAELLGNHTDYNEGYVLALAVDRGTTLSGQKRDDGRIELHSRELNQTETITLEDLDRNKVADWARGVEQQCLSGECDGSFFAEGFRWQAGTDGDRADFAKGGT